MFQRKMHCRFRVAACASVLGLTVVGFGSASHAADPDKAVDAIKTASPIKHVIIVIGENRSFDHVFATYQPKHKHEKVLNLLSEGIVNADGTPGRNFAKAFQFKIVAPPNNGKYFISADLKDKQLYTFLPPPDIGGLPAVSALSFILSIPGGDPALRPEDQYLFGTGGTGLAATLGPDSRITNVNTLPPGPFQITGPTMPYDAFTADTIHQIFQMWQQMDCAIDTEHASRDNPSGCLHDLQSAVTTTYSTPPGAAPHDTGQTMGFYNVQQGDAPVLKALADKYTLSDNYHQPVMGGTQPDINPLVFADQVFFSDGHGNAVTPPATRIYNADPQPGTLNLYTSRAQWFICSDKTQPGVKAITDYLSKLPYEVSTNCDPGHYYNSPNINPAFAADGTPTGTPDNNHPTNNIVPPVTLPSIGDLLNEKRIPWKFYSGGYNLAIAHAAVSGYCSVCNPFQYLASYPFQRADHIEDITDLYADLAGGTLPAVSWVHPDGATDGHPASSKLDLYEALVDNLVQLAQSNKEQWAETAIFVTFDEGGGFYDSGFIQPVDFFGTGPRIPMIAVSPFSKGGHISHVYNEHSSFVKFVERNWKLNTTLSDRSRDNLPNPEQDDDDNIYVPRNMPAIGDLFDMFDFARRDDDHRDGNGHRQDD